MGIYGPQWENTEFHGLHSVRGPEQVLDEPRTNRNTKINDFLKR